jgi:isopentenyldiphosphate isomerase
MSTEETLDLVNEDDEVIGTSTCSEIYAKDLKFVRVVNVFIKNNEDKIWIPTRTSHKQIAPNGYDVGVGGHVEHGETYQEAFAKEVREEIGWEVRSLNYKEIGKFGPRDGLSCVSMIYEIESNDDPELNSEDFSHAEWLDPDEVAKRINEGHLAKSDIIPLLKLVYGI